MTIKPQPIPPPPVKNWPVKLNIAGVTNPGIIKTVNLPAHVRPYLSELDPPPEWYQVFSSAQYTIERIGGRGPHRLRPGQGIYRLTPVVNRPVYTFNDWGDFIDQSRDFTVALFTTDFFVTDVAQYRVRHGRPIVHVVYRLPPDWTWREP